MENLADISLFNGLMLNSLRRSFFCNAEDDPETDDGYNDPPTWGETKWKSKCDAIDKNVKNFVKAAQSMQEASQALWKDYDIWSNWGPLAAEQMKYYEEWGKVMRTIKQWPDEYKIKQK